MRQIIRALGVATVVGGLSTVALADLPGPDALGVVVDVTTGSVRLVGNDSDPTEFVAYEIDSASGSLNPAGWNSLQDQGFGGFVELGGTANVLAEGTFSPASTFDSVGRSIGNAFTVGAAQDLVFLWVDENNNTFTGTVEYLNVPEPASLGLAAVGSLLALRRRR